MLREIAELQKRVNELIIPESLPASPHKADVRNIQELGISLDDDLKGWAVFIAEAQALYHKLSRDIYEENDSMSESILILKRERALQDAITSARILKHSLSSRHKEALGVRNIGVIEGYRVVSYDKSYRVNAINIEVSVSRL